MRNRLVNFMFARSGKSRKAFGVFSRRLLFCALSCLLTVLTAYSQNTQSAKPDFKLDFRNDPCGNPFIESLLWMPIKGRVSKIVDGHTLLVAFKKHQTLEVQLTGIVVDSSGPYSEQAKKFLHEELLKKNVEVRVNDGFNGELPESIVAQVDLSAKYDVARMLLAKGLVRFEQPPHYTISRYEECQYRNTEAAAR